MMLNRIPHPDVNALKVLTAFLCLLVGLAAMVYPAGGLAIMSPLFLVFSFLIITKNGVLSFYGAFLISLLISTTSYLWGLGFSFVESLNGVLAHGLYLLKKEFNLTVITVVLIGGFVAVVIRGRGAESFARWMKKIAALRTQRFLGACIGLLSFFTNQGALTSMIGFFQDEFENESLDPEERKELLRICIMFSNLSVSVITVSVWGIFFQGIYPAFTSEARYGFYLKALPYPLAVIFTFFVMKPLLRSLPTRWTTAFVQKMDGSRRLWMIPGWIRYGLNRLFMKLASLKPSRGGEKPIEIRPVDPWDLFLLFVIPFIIFLFVLMTWDFIISVENYRLLGALISGISACYLGGLIRTFSLRLFIDEELFCIPERAAKMKSAVEKIFYQEGLRSIERQYVAKKKSRGRMLPMEVDKEFLRRLQRRFSLSILEQKYIESLRFYYKKDLDRLGAGYHAWRILKKCRKSSSEFMTALFEGMKLTLEAVGTFLGVFLIKDLIWSPSPKEVGGEIDLSRFGDFEQYRLSLMAIHQIPEIQLPMPFLPIYAFLFATALGVSIGSAWGTFAISYSVMMVLLKASMVEGFLDPWVVGSLICASTFGNQFSPYAPPVLLAEAITGVPSERLVSYCRKEATGSWLLTALFFFGLGFVQPSVSFKEAMLPLFLILAGYFLLKKMGKE